MAPDRVPKQILTLSQKEEILRELGVDALLPGPPLIHQRAVQPAQGPHLHHVCWRDPRLRQPALRQHGAASAAQMRSAAHALCNSTVTGNNTWVTLHGRQRARYGRSGSLSPSICRARAYPQPPNTPSRHVGQPIPPTANRNSTNISLYRHHQCLQALQRGTRKPAKASAGCRALISSSSH